MEKSTFSSAQKNAKTKKRGTVNKLKHINPRHFNNSFARLRLVGPVAKATSRLAPLAPAPVDTSINTSSISEFIECPPILPDHPVINIPRAFPGTNFASSSPYTVHPLPYASEGIYSYSIPAPSMEVDFYSQLSPVLSYGSGTLSCYPPPSLEETFSLGDETENQKLNTQGLFTDYNQYSPLFEAQNPLDGWLYDTQGYSSIQDPLYPIYHPATGGHPEVLPHLQETTVASINRLSTFQDAYHPLPSEINPQLFASTTCHLQVLGQMGHLSSFL